MISEYEKFVPLAIPIQGVFLMVLLVSANFLAETFPCKIQGLLKSSMVMKHFFGLLTMTFFVILTLPNAPNEFHVIFKQSLVMYILFVLLTKTHALIFILTICILGGIYIIDIFKNELKTNQTIILNSTNNEKTKQTYIASSKIKEKEYDTIKAVLYIVTFVFILLGVLTYMGEKKLEYRKNFSYYYFFFGKTACKGDIEHYNVAKMFNSLAHALN